jgi:transcriptional regulator with XRE-family HTH domain
MNAEQTASADRAMAEAVKTLMKLHGPARGISSSQALAARSGIKYGTLRKRLDAAQSFTYDQLHAIARELGVTVTDMVNLAETAAQTLPGPRIAPDNEHMKGKR